VGDLSGLIVIGAGAESGDQVIFIRHKNKVQERIYRSKDWMKSCLSGEKVGRDL